MQYRFRRPARACAGAVILGFVSACGGGGGGTPPVQTPISIPPAPGVGQIATGSVVSNAGGSGGGQTRTDTVFSISSNPAGLSVSENGRALGSTPLANYTPAVSTAAEQLAFSSGPSPAYSISVTQTRDGARSLYYNAAADSSGSINLSTIQSLRRSTRSVAAAGTGTLVRRPHRPQTPTPVGTSDIVPNEFVVRYRPAILASSGRRPADIERQFRAAGKDLPTIGDPLRAVVVPSGQQPADFARKLAASPEVAYVHPVHVRHLTARAQAAVNDPLFSTINQWYLAATGAPYAWSYSTGSNVTIAVIDTGFDNANTDIASKVLRQGKAVSSGNFTTPAALQVGAGAAQDSNGHGTSVTGLAAAAANNGYGFASIGYDANLLVYDVFADTTANTGESPPANGVDEATAIDDAVANGADVINLSLGSPSFDDAEQNAVELALSKGVTVVAAAGNNADGSQSPPANSGTLDYPGAYDGVISVGASALNDSNPSPDTSGGVYAGSTEFVAPYSQYGTGLGLVAPGGSVSDSADNDSLHWIRSYSTTTAGIPAMKCSSAGGVCQALYEGTSQATPQVSGAAALLIALAGGHGKLTPAQVAQVLFNTADNINDPRQGHGRLNAYRALAAYLHDTSTATGPATTPSGSANFSAFAYTNSGANRPKILDVNFPSGVPVDANGNFRIADVPANTGTFKVGVWYDANGNGYIDPGDQVGIAAATCSATAPCTLGQIDVKPVTAAFALP